MAVLNIIGRESSALVGLNVDEQWTNGGSDQFNEPHAAVGSLLENPETQDGSRETLPRRISITVQSLPNISDRRNETRTGSDRSRVIADTSPAHPQLSNTRSSVSPRISNDDVELIAESSGFVAPNSTASTSRDSTATKKPATNNSKSKKRPSPSSSNAAFGFDDELRQERMKNLKLHNELMEMQIQYLRLKSEKVKSELENLGVDFMQ